jgi:hypothetical protein
MARTVHGELLAEGLDYEPWHRKGAPASLRLRVLQLEAVLALLLHAAVDRP